MVRGVLSVQGFKLSLGNTLDSNKFLVFRPAECV